MRAQVSRDLGLETGVDLVQEVHHHDVLGGDGAVRLQLETPVALRALPGDQRVARERDGTVEERRDRLGERERYDVRPSLGPGTGLQSGGRCDAAQFPELPYERRRCGSDSRAARSSSTPEGGSNSVRTACGRRSSPSRPSGNPRAAPANRPRSMKSLRSDRSVSRRVMDTADRVILTWEPAVKPGLL